ncbi:MAG: GAF domain-containing sensor histidine kinase [Microbacterium ginsengisoli]|uniref:sensor histidine kinase n=1 Tax=Microbacterium TaxID=33882 RepID=UPI0006FE4415|nr:MULTISPECIES: GAF domain-containing sensor histidine kinase [unclassified Microbacterium]MBN9198845.1 GAF domain-containing sensor histidine kinase [Microbacterium ginsengisoli]KQR92366.1 histidine kinase [Microbacterium sp. Leaf351]KQR92906.1 histidine kinase [Microbacterium sp. Leaf347]ODU78010.1 MAG: histidine kinase [Microbacterium sp. SCN 71-21]OJU74677.1 MAG: histidine kinase [Microbacterium sp. 71-23]
MSTAHDVTRRQTIADYELLEDPPESDLQGLVQLAATICGVPTAVINIIDDRFQHQIAAVGFTAAVCSRDDSMCAVVLEQPGRVIVPDARLDDRFAANPFVTGVIGNVRFYASSPLITPSGIAIGTLCIFDEEVGELSAEHAATLDILAHQVVDVLELRRVTRELQTSNHELEQFAGRISHDLRNPLMALSGFIELAADSPELSDAPQASRALARAEAAADRMSTMISDLLDFARVGGEVPRVAAVDVEDVMAAVIDDLDTPLAQTGATIEVDAPAPVVADPTLLRGLLQNLVANAVKFSATTSDAPHIIVRVEPLPDGSRITVDDNGPGIPEPQREKVFGLMERGDQTDVAGLGIGLSTCRRIVEGHHGRIGIAESPAGGASVWVVLPHAA